MDIGPTQWIYLSPHLDDAALSCGGLIWEQARTGLKVAIWTICAGAAPRRALSPFALELQARWETGPETVEVRREEDRLACQRLGAETHYFDIPDCIYRYRQLPDGEQPLIQTEAGLNETDPEVDLVADLASILVHTLPPGTAIVCPVALGSHVDHRLTRAAAEKSGLPLFYYPDYPYVLRCADELSRVESGLWQRIAAPISTGGLAAWQDAVTAYSSQISTFWKSSAETRLSIQNYWAGGGGRLWVPQTGGRVASGG